MSNLLTDIAQITNNYTTILSIPVLKEHNLYWGKNGIGDRWNKKQYNYSVIYSNGKINTYSENEADIVSPELVNQYMMTNPKEKGFGIVGIFVHGKRTFVQSRPIRSDIIDYYKTKSCVVCGSSSSLVCDHKNDLYNDERVLKQSTQHISDFQSLCNHCNLQKRQICKWEREKKKIYSAKNLEPFKQYTFDFPWEKKAFDEMDITCKLDTYWHDPVEFHRKLCCYLMYVFPLLHTIRNL